MFTSRSVGSYVASEVGNVIARRLAKPQSDPTALVILGHGSNGDSIFAQGAEEPSLASVKALVDAGYNISTGDYSSPTHWGNPTSVTRVGQLKTYAQGAAAPISSKSGGVYIFAKSMGTLAAMNYARANPGTVKAIAAIWPAVDLNDFYVNNRGGYAAEISTTYGGAPPASSNPSANTADLVGLPIRLYYTSGDTIVVPSTVTAFASAVSSCSTVQIGTGDHGTQTSFSIADVISFFGAHP